MIRKNVDEAVAPLGTKSVDMQGPPKDAAGTWNKSPQKSVATVFVRPCTLAEKRHAMTVTAIAKCPGNVVSGKRMSSERETVASERRTSVVIA
jgi:hypothetical protein